MTGLDYIDKGIFKGCQAMREATGTAPSSKKNQTLKQEKVDRNDRFDGPEAKSVMSVVVGCPVLPVKLELSRGHPVLSRC